jgi:hypothetical protein
VHVADGQDGRIEEVNKGTLFYTVGHLSQNELLPASTLASNQFASPL